MTLKGIIRFLILLVGYVLLLGGIYLGIVATFTPGEFIIIDTLLMCIFPVFAIYAFFLYPIIMVAMARLHRTKPGRKWIVPIILGGIVLTFCALPFTGISTTVTQGESQFASTFGADYMDDIPSNLTSKFQPIPFDLWRMFNNYEDYECNFTKDKDYYLMDPISNDKFYFDYYCPTTGAGPFPTIINLHGGAWVLGNKGVPENRPMASRYLAQQGYVVLDVQYGLGTFPEDPLVNGLLGMVQSLMGRQMLNRSYTVSEMAVQVVGNLTDYIAGHATDLKIDTSRIYVTGESAGAHLTGLFLGWNKTGTIYKEIFNTTLTLKGLIMFYCPANVTDLYITHANDPLSKTVNLGSFMEKVFGGTPQANKTLFEMLDPVNLTNEYSPPCLILHGEKDMMAPYRDAVVLKNRLDDNNVTNIMLSFPYQGHAFDFFFNSPGGQVAMYYMERFLAATQYC